MNGMGFFSFFDSFGYGIGTRMTQMTRIKRIFLRISLRDKGIHKSRDGFIRFINFFSSFSFLILLVFWFY